MDTRPRGVVATLRGLVPALVLALLGLAPRSALGQTLSGVVVSEIDGGPLTGAVVELQDPAGSEVAARLTRPDGTFSFRDVGPGRYRFSVGLLGYRTVTTAPFTLEPGQTLHRRLAIPLEPIRLDGLRVSQGRRCDRDFGGTGLVRLWEEARKALKSVVLTDASPYVSFRIAVRERDLAPDGRTVLAERVSTNRAWGNDPFRSAPAETLFRDGFIRSEVADTVTYFAPDARLLLSDAFLEQYCFGITEGRDGEVGLTFEPAERLRATAQVEGVLWLDGTTAALRRLEFEYTRSPTVADFTPEGEVTYEQLSNGAWIIREWWIRMPRPAIVNGLPTGRLGGIREKIGEVVEVLGLGQRVRPRPVTGAVHGRVLAERTDEPLGNVLVYLNGTGMADTTAIDGSYRIAGVRPGRYRVGWTHSQLRSATAPPVLRPVDVTADDDAVVDFHVALPPRLAAGCPIRGGAVGAGGGERRDQDDRAREEGAVWGRVVDRTTGVPLAGVQVTLSTGETPQASTTDPEDMPALPADGAPRHVRSDGRGVFRFCDVEPGEYRVAAGLPGAETTTRRVDLSPGSAELLELAVAVATAGDEPARLVGRILDAATDTALAGVTIGVGSEIDAVSDADGRFMVEELRPGTYPVRASTLGYADAEGVVQLEAGQTVTVEVRIAHQPIPLDPIVVTAARVRLAGSGRLSDFTYRMERGWGTYILRDEIQRRQPYRLTTILQEHGFRVYHNGAQLVNPRYGCAPMVYLDGVPITYFHERGGAGSGATGEAAAAVNMVHPLEVAGIEVYKGASQIPATFGGSTARCGVIAIWTRGHGGGPPPDTTGGT